MRKKLRPQEIDKLYREIAGEDVDVGYEWDAIAWRSWVQYGSAIRLYRAWCAEADRTPHPPDPATVREYIHHMVEAGRGVQTVRTLLSALGTVSRLLGQRFERHRFRDMVKGINRKHGRPRRRARPILPDELKAILKWLGKSDHPRDVRDAAILVFGWGATLRQSEIVALDWARHGIGDGILVRDERGLTATLIRSKASQEEAVDVILTRKDMPTAYAAIERWVELAKIEPGDPVFRPIVGSTVLPRSLGADEIARIIKRRVYGHAIETGAKAAIAAERKLTVSGHSLRAGGITAAALKGVPEWKIRQHSRHKSAEQVAGYVRAAAHWRDGAMKGVGF